MPMSPEVADLDSIFDAASGGGLTRDRYDRPMLIPTPERLASPLVKHARGDEKRWPDRLPYTRASSMGNYVSDHTAIDTWQKRSLTKGMGEREDLASLAAALPPIISNQRDKAGMTKAEKIQDDLTNARLDEIAEEAMKHANRDYKAGWGTAIHSFTDPGGGTSVPTRMMADVASWFEATLGWEVHATETFVANDERQSAGSFDHLVSIPWLPELGRLIVDKKTGLLHPDQFAIQQTVYAEGEPYDPTDDSRPGWPDGIAPSRDWAIIAHIPLGLGRTDFYLANLDGGKEGADIAVRTRAYRSRKDLMEPIDIRGKGQEHVASLIAVADSRQTMTAIAEQWRPLWNDSLRTQARQRLAQIEG